MVNIYKKIGLGFLGLITLLICVSFVLPSEVHVSRSAIIKAPAYAAFDQVNNLKNWGKWSPWHQMDTTMLLVYEGPESGTGAKYNWESTEVGTGSLAITAVKPNQQIETELNFGGMGISKGIYTFVPVAEGTKVTWAMDSDGKGMAWYWVVPSRYMNLFMGDMLCNDFDKGLANLKTLVEKMPTTPAAPQISEKKIAAQPALTIKATCSQEELEQKLIDLHTQIAAYIKENNLEAAGKPFAIYHAYDPKKISFEAGIPVVTAGKSNNTIKATELKAGRVVMAAHYGKAEDTYNTHMLIDAYLKRHNMEQTASPWEVYASNPQEVQDPNRRLTEIYYPVK